MPRAIWPPPVTPHRGQDTIRVVVNGVKRRVKLGPSGSDGARREYLRVVAELEQSRAAGARPGRSATVAEVAAAFLNRCKAEVSPKQHHRACVALRPALELYGHTAAAEFGPLALAACRARHVEAGYCRGQCNAYANVVRQAVRWAVSVEMVPADVLARLRTLEPLRRGRTAAPDHPRVCPAPAQAVEAALPLLGPAVADMVRLQLLTGMRPGELVRLRPCDVVRPWRSFGGVGVWLYHLEAHKTSWKGGDRDVAIGPKAQAVLAPYLERGAGEFCFSPAEATAARRARQREARRSKVQPSQLCRAKAQPRKSPGGRYTTDSYRQAVLRACRRAGVEPWSPNRLRHAAGTRIRAEHGKDAAQSVLGHADASTTEVYAQRCEVAGAVAAKAG